MVEQLFVPGEEVLEPPDVVSGDAAQVHGHVLLLARDLQRRQREVAVTTPPHSVPGTIINIIITITITIIITNITTNISINIVTIIISTSTIINIST